MMVLLWGQLGAETQSPESLYSVELSRLMAFLCSLPRLAIGMIELLSNEKKRGGIVPVSVDMY